MFGFISNTARGQQIIPDGKTNTSLSVTGNVTDVSTTTKKGTNAFNSFSKFDVDAGKTVNLQVPNDSENLINLIHDESSEIEGKLNSFQNGQIGGNIFLVNPHGITVGSQGVINVGSLTAITPTVDFMKTTFDAPGIPNDEATAAILNTNTPDGNLSTFVNNGKINAISDVKIETRWFTNNGQIYTNAQYSNPVSTEDIVNLNSTDYVDADSLILENGNITLTTGAVVNEGQMYAGENINAISVSVDGGHASEFVAGNDFNLNNNLHPDNPEPLEQVSLYGNVDAGGSIEISNFTDGIFIYGSDIQADNDIDLIANVIWLKQSGSPSFRTPYIQAQNINIQPIQMLEISDCEIQASNLLTVNKPEWEIHLNPQIIEAGSLNSDFMGQNSPIDIDIVGHVTIGNIDNIFIGGAPLNPSLINLTGYSVTLSGNNSTTGDMNIATTNYPVTVYGTNSAGNDINLISNDYIIGSNASITAGNNIIFSRRTAGDIEISDTGILTPYEIDKVNGNIVIGNHPNTNSLTDNVNINQSIYTDGNSIEFNSNDSVFLRSNNLPQFTIISTRDLGDIWSEDHLTALSEGNSGRITFISDLIDLGNAGLLASANNGYASNDISLNAVDAISSWSVEYSAKNINFDAGNEIYLLSSNVKAENINLDTRVIYLFDDNHLEGSNISIRPQMRLYSYGPYNTIDAQNHLILNGGNIEDAGIIFYVDRITAKTLESDFLKSDIVIDSDSVIWLGYLNNIIIDGQPYTPDNINITAYAIIVSDLSAKEDINLQANDIFVSSAQANNISILPREILRLDGTIDAQNHLVLNGGNIYNSGGLLEASTLDLTANNIYSYLPLNVTSTTDITTTSDAYIAGKAGALTANTGGLIEYHNIDASSVDITAGGMITLYNGTITGNADLYTTAPAVSGPAEINLGYTPTDLTIGGDLVATATQGNVYYYGGHVGGNATINAGEHIPDRLSVGLGRYRDLTIGGNLTVDTPGNIGYMYGDVTGSVNILDADLAGLMDIGIGNDLTVNANAFGYFGGDVGGDVTITAPDGIMLGAGKLLTTTGNVTANALNGSVGYYLGNVSGDLNINAADLVNVGNVDDIVNETFTYNSITYDITDLTNPIPPDTNTFTVGNNVNINTGSLINFEGNILGTVSATGSHIELIETGDVDINQISVTNLADISSLEGSILDARPTEDANIIARDVNLYAPNGTIGTEDDDLNIDLLASTLNVTADGDINIVEPNSNIVAGLLKSISGNIMLAALNGDININRIESMQNINLSADSITLLPEGEIFAGENINLIADKMVFQDNSVLDAGNNINAISNSTNWLDYISVKGSFSAGNDINVEIPDADLSIDNATVIAGNNINLVADTINIAQHGSVLSPTVFLQGQNISILPETVLGIYNCDIQASNLLTLNKPAQSFYFQRATINTGTLSSDFISQNGPLDLAVTGGLLIDNLTDNFTIGGQPLNLSSINLSAMGLEFWGNYSVSGDVNITANGIDNMLSVYGNIDAGNDINVSSEGEVYFGGMNDTVEAGRDININTKFGWFMTYSPGIIVTDLVAGRNITINALKLDAPTPLTIKGNLIAENISITGNALKFDCPNNNEKITASGIVNIETLTDGIVFNNYDIASQGNITITSAADVQTFNNAISVITGTSSSLLVNSDGTINSSSTINAIHSGGTINVEDVSVNPSGGTINITGNLTGTGSLIANGKNTDINITNNSINNLKLNNLSTSGTGQDGQIIVNGVNVYDDIITPGGTIDVQIGSGSGTGAINVNNNTASNILVAGTVYGNTVSMNNATGNIYNSGGLLEASTLDLTANNIYSYLPLNVTGTTDITTTADVYIAGKAGTLTANTGGLIEYHNIDASSVDITAGGMITLYNGTITGNADIYTTAPAAAGPAEINLGYTPTDLTIGGDLVATATQGNVYYYGGHVGGNATINAGEHIPDRLSVGLGRYRDLTIGGNLTVDTPGNIGYMYGDVTGSVNILDADLAGLMDIGIGNDLTVNANAFGYFGGDVGGDVTITAPDGIMLGAGKLLTTTGNVTANALNGSVGYYLGNVSGDLNINAADLVNVGNVDDIVNETFTYNSITYDITDLTNPIPPDTNTFTVGNNVNINTGSLINFEGNILGTVSATGSHIELIETGDVDINQISVTNLADISSLEGSILDANADDNVNISAQDLTLNASTNIGSNANYLDIMLTGDLNAEAGNNIYISEHNSDLVANRINSTGGSAYIVAADGNATIDYISAPVVVDVQAAGNIDINTLDPARVYLKTLMPGSYLKVVDGMASESVEISSDNIEATFSDTDNKNPLAYTITGTNNNAAKTVNIATNNSKEVVFNALKTDNATLSTNSNATLTLKNTVINNSITTKSDYLIAKENNILTNIRIAGSNNGYAKNIDIDNTGNLNVAAIKTDKATIKTSGDTLTVTKNADIKDEAIFSSNKSTIIIDKHPPIYLDLPADITYDEHEIVFLTDFRNDINLVSSQAEDEANKVEQADTVKQASDDNNDTIQTLHVDANLYSSDDYENYIILLLEQADDIYQKAMASGETEEAALKKATAYLKKAQITPDVAKALLKKTYIQKAPQLQNLLKLLAQAPFYSASR
jgi:filamentous hemagglutinin family protein